MKNSLILIFVLLLIITIATTCVSNSLGVTAFVIPLIMVFAALKFLLVAFHFMELKKAHSFWKISLVLTLGLIMVLIIGTKGI
jgi:caa(3)-type oxidase subunit IV